MYQDGTWDYIYISHKPLWVSLFVLQTYRGWILKVKEKKYINDVVDYWASDELEMSQRQLRCEARQLEIKYINN